MVSISSVEAVPGAGGFFFDDKKAIKNGAEKDGASYEGEPLTPGFSDIRQPAEAVSVLIELEDGQVGLGDCAAVQYSGARGRDAVFDAEESAEVIESTIADRLVGRPADKFVDNVQYLESIGQSSGVELHTAEEYGVSQALLDAAAKAKRQTIAETVVDTYETEPATEPIPIYAQSGDERYQNVEKMLVKGIPILPHGLFNTREKIGEDGERLVQYLEWLSNRAEEIGPDSYEPRFHVDVYGMLGEVFDPPYDSQVVVDYFAELKEAAAPFSLQVESPMEMESRSAQIQTLAELRDGLRDGGVNVDIVADEWCNTLDDVKSFVDNAAVDIVQIKTPDVGPVTDTIKAVNYCNNADTKAFIGGSCAETDVSSRVCAQVAIATRPAQVFAKPGMGVDEGYMIVNNEMRRTLSRMSQ